MNFEFMKSGPVSKVVCAWTEHRAAYTLGEGWEGLSQLLAKATRFSRTV